MCVLLLYILKAAANPTYADLRFSLSKVSGILQADSPILLLPSAWYSILHTRTCPLCAPMFAALRCGHNSTDAQYNRVICWP